MKSPNRFFSTAEKMLGSQVQGIIATLKKKISDVNPAFRMTRCSRPLMERSRVREEWLNVGQKNGKTAWVLSTEWKSRANPLSLPSSLPDTRRCGMFGKGREGGTKGWVTNAELRRPAELFGQNPAKWKDGLLLGCAVGQREHSGWAHWKGPGRCLLTQIYHFKSTTATTN